MIFDSFDLAQKSPFGAAMEGEEMNFSLKTDRREGVVAARLIFTNDDNEQLFYPMEWCDLCEGYDRYTVKTKAPKAGLWFYEIELLTPYGIRYAGPGRGHVDLWLEPYKRQQTVYKKGFHTPDFLKGGVIYQIFVDRFNRSSEKITPIRDEIIFHQNKKDTPEFRPDEKGIVQNIDFFGGNLPGITEKLPYLKELGVTALYLNPIFKARSNHKYDTGDYMVIDPMFGDEKDFRLLCDKAKELQISIILDGVFNHTGDDSLYFNRYGNYPSLGAYQSRDSFYYSWYSFKEYPEEYDCWWGVKILPAVNDEVASFREFITGEDGVLRHYLCLGASGFRLDVADELGDSFLDDIRTAIKACKDDAVIIGEVWEDASNKISYGRRRRYLLGDELDSVMNYPLKDAIIDFLKTGNTEGLKSTVETLCENYPKQALNSLMNILGTHDTARILTVLGESNLEKYSREEKAGTFLKEDDRTNAKRKLFIASALLFTLPGVPTIFYGDEAGLEGFEDPFNRRFYPWGEEDSEIVSHYRKLGTIREKSKALKNGDYRTLHAENGVFLFERKDDDVLLCCANCSNVEFQFFSEYTLVDIYHGEEKKGLIKVAPFSFGIYEKKV